MALYTFSLTSTPRPIPAKNPASTASILRASFLILHHPDSSFSLSSKSVSARASPNPIQATQPLKHVYPDPIPEFAVAETRKFREEILGKLSKDKEAFGDDLEIVVNVCAEETRKFREEILRKLSKDKEAFGDDLEIIVNVCAEIFCEFLHNEYSGPGTLLVEPFTKMFVSLNEKKLPRASLAARACLLWAQNYVDEDWDVWNRNRNLSSDHR